MYCNSYSMDFYAIAASTIHTLICFLYVYKLYLLPFFQFTATGVAGLHGPIVTSRVTVEARQESACVIILNRRLAGKTAKIR